MKKRSPGAPRAVHHVFRQPLKIIRIVVLFVADHVDQPRPAAADADYFVTFTQRPKRDRTNRRIQSWHVAASRQDSDYALSYVDIRHGALLASVWITKQMIMDAAMKFWKGQRSIKLMELCNQN